MTHKATLIRKLKASKTGASKRLWRLDPPLMTYEGSESHSIVVTSAVAVMRPETYIFPADKHGNITSWAELPGSFQGDLNHEKAIENAGYVIVE